MAIAILMIGTAPLRHCGQDITLAEGFPFES